MVGYVFIYLFVTLVDHKSSHMGHFF